VALLTVDAGDGVPAPRERISAPAVAANGGSDHVDGAVGHPKILNRRTGHGNRKRLPMKDQRWSPL
jgi:hypothetical protein